MYERKFPTGSADYGDKWHDVPGWKVMAVLLETYPGNDAKTQQFRDYVWTQIDKGALFHTMSAIYRLKR